MTVFKEDFLERIVNIHFPTQQTFNFVGTTSIGHRGINPIVLGDTTVTSTVALPENLIWKDPPGIVFPASNTHVSMGGVSDLHGLENLFVDYNYSPAPPLPFTITTVWNLTSVAGVIDPTISCSVHVTGGALQSASKDILIDNGSFGPPASTSVTTVITMNVDGTYTVSIF